MKKLRLSTEGSQAKPCSPPTPIFIGSKEEKEINKVPEEKTKQK